MHHRTAVVATPSALPADTPPDPSRPLGSNAWSNARPQYSTSRLSTATALRSSPTDTPPGSATIRRRPRKLATCVGTTLSLVNYRLQRALRCC